jgi:hypothetical protein
METLWNGFTYYRQLMLREDIAAFEAWQREPDEDYNYEAIHVALLLSMEPYGSR